MTAPPDSPDAPMNETSKAAQTQHALLGMVPGNEVVHTNHPEAAWFANAGLGLFIHWGIACVHGNLDLSWAMIADTTWDCLAQGRNKVTPSQYWKLAERFNPQRYDPDRWLAAAARAGFKYAVLTAMHHDGYTMWPSRVGEFGVQTYLPGRDFVRQFVEACRRNGLKVGLYYSPPDWYFDREYMSFSYRSFGLLTNNDNQANGEVFNQDHQIVPRRIPPPDHADQKRQRFHARVEELLTNYGRIDLLWFDGGAHDNQIRDRARKLQPHIVINNRSCDGDYDHTECELPSARPKGWFETCHCWQACDILRPNGDMLDVWGYLSTEQYKPARWMLQTYDTLRAWNANLLLNVGPRPTGELPDVVYQRLEEVGPEIVARQSCAK